MWDEQPNGDVHIKPESICLHLELVIVQSVAGVVVPQRQVEGGAEKEAGNWGAEEGKVGLGRTGHLSIANVHRGGEVSQVVALTGGLAEIRLVVIHCAAFSGPAAAAAAVPKGALLSVTKV